MQADRRGGAMISQPFRPDSTVALPDRSLGDLVGEELRRLDPDEPYRRRWRRPPASRPGRPVTRARARVVRPGRGVRERARRRAGSRPLPSRPAAPGRRPDRARRLESGTDEVAEHGEHDTGDRAGR